MIVVSAEAAEWPMLMQSRAKFICGGCTCGGDSGGTWQGSMDRRAGRARRPCKRDDTVKPGIGGSGPNLAELTAAFAHVAHGTSLSGALRAARTSRCSVRRPRPRPAARRCVVARAGSGLADDDGDDLGLHGGGRELLGEWMPASPAFWFGDEEAGGEDGTDAANPVMAVVGGGGLEFADGDDEFAGDDEDDLDDDDDDDDEDKEDEEDEDEDLASYEIETVDEDDEVPSPAAREVRGKASLGLGGVEGDEEDDVDDFEESTGDLVDVSSSASALEGDEEVSAMGVGSEGLDGGDIDIDVGDDLDADLDPADELFDEESEAELLSAAETLKGSGLLGLGVEGASRSSSSELADFLGEDDEEGSDNAPPPKKSPVSSSRSRGPQPSPALADLPELVRNSEVEPIPLEEDDSEETTGLMSVSNDEFDDAPVADEDPLLAGPKNLDAYTDDDEHDDEVVEFGVTTATSFGRIWELNDDAFVTITEPGEAYAYDIDEADQEDQDSAVLRRGKAGGWGGGLASDGGSNLKTGSKEWVARRAYDLVTKSSASEMFVWTRARKSPPDDISALFPPEPEAAPRFGATALPTGGMGLDGEDDEDWLEGDADGLGNEVGSVAASPLGSRVDGAAVNMSGGENPGLDAIERSVDFPCLYKFKVVGSGDGFVESLTADMEAVLGREVPSSAFEFEPAGRYERITINVEVESARQVTELYEAIRMATGVKFSYG